MVRTGAPSELHTAAATRSDTTTDSGSTAVTVPITHATDTANGNDSAWATHGAWNTRGATIRCARWTDRRESAR